MDKNVIISIKGRQTIDDDDQEIIELITAGTLADCGDEGFTISYQESMVTGLEGTLTTLHVEKERVTMLRIGAVNSQMVFEEGRRHLSLYETPYGALSIGVNTRKMHSTMSYTGGDVTIDYALEIDHALAGRNLFQINVKEAAARTLPQ